MKNYFYFPSTFFGFVGRGYGRGRTKRSICGCGYLVAMKKGGNYAVVPVTQTVMKKVIPPPDYFVVQMAEERGTPTLLTHGMDKVWKFIKNVGKETAIKTFNGIVDSNSITRGIARVLRNPVREISDFASNKLVKYANPLRFFGNGRGKFKKGSPQAKLLMARLRAMRKARGRGIKGLGIKGMGRKKSPHLKKGSLAAKIYMARLRAMRRKIN